MIEVNLQLEYWTSQNTPRSILIETKRQKERIDEKCRKEEQAQENTSTLKHQNTYTRSQSHSNANRLYIANRTQQSQRKFSRTNTHTGINSLTGGNQRQAKQKAIAVHRIQIGHTYSVCLGVDIYSRVNRLCCAIRALWRKVKSQ